MELSVLTGIMIPFIGTMLGSACVFFMTKKMNTLIQKLLLGFASGVMVAASVWSLLIPSLDLSASLGKFAFIPAVIGFLLGMMFLLLLDHFIPHMHLDQKIEGKKSSLKKSTMLVLAVTLHNIPEGMAVGVVFAGMMIGNQEITFMSAIALALGIAIQNFPEGAIISMPLRSEGISKKKAFTYGTLSGIVEPIASLITILLSQFIIPVLPYLLSFAAGAMVYVVIEELIPEASIGKHSNIATIGFAIGFVIMMILDVSLG
ncbi:MAG: ZIP family metal transporter [Coprobacillus sp.]|nr:ZIP family metal transporter [Coprobacillus sp.]